MSMPLYESALQGDRKRRSLSLCFFFFFPRRRMASGTLPEPLWRLLQLRSRRGIWQCPVAHCWITHPSDDALAEAHSGEEGPLREDEEASRWEWSIQGKHAPPEGKGSLISTSGFSPFIFRGFSSTFSMNRGRQEILHSHKIPPT